MKIALLNAFYHPNIFGGAEISVQNLAETLARRGMEVAVISSSPDGNSYSETINGVRSHHIDAAQAGKSVADANRTLADRVLWHLSAEVNPRPARLVTEILSDMKPDIVHTNSITSFSSRIFPVLKRSGIPVVHTLRDYYLLCPLTTMHKNGVNCANRCTSCSAFTWSRRRNSNSISSVVGVSKWILERHLRFGLFDPAADKSVIHNSYELPDGERNLEPRRSGEKLRLGYIGRLHPIKGLSSVLDALVTELPDSWTFEIAGSGISEFENALRARYERDNVRFLGWQKTASFLDRIDALVVPSIWHEPLARGILEAYAHGVPVLAAAVGGIPEIVDVGRTGWLFEAGNIESIRDVLRPVIARPELARELAQNCRLRARDFAHEEITRRYVDVYEKTLNKRR